jgi:hypothetical protein
VSRAIRKSEDLPTEHGFEESLTWGQESWVHSRVYVETRVLFFQVLRFSKDDLRFSAERRSQKP